MRNPILAVFFLSLMVLACGSVQQIAQATATAPPAELPETETSIIEYPTVVDALAGLKARDDVIVEVKDGWTIVTETDDLITWSFAPSGHPAHPAVAKRVFYEEEGGWYVKMSILCEADKAACDQFGRDFEALNEQMRKFIEQDKLTQQANP
ncbi:MAG TPA: hypothetical protein VK880_00010 [Anaerolineales bacterium]|nr:hypothetical protein [Anaerolineales bacterium]